MRKLLLFSIAYTPADIERGEPPAAVLGGNVTAQEAIELLTSLIVERRINARIQAEADKIKEAAEAKPETAKT